MSSATPLCSASAPATASATSVTVAAGRPVSAATAFVASSTFERFCQNCKSATSEMPWSAKVLWVLVLPLIFFLIRQAYLTSQAPMVGEGHGPANPFNTGVIAQRVTDITEITPALANIIIERYVQPNFTDFTGELAYNQFFKGWLDLEEGDKIITETGSLPFHVECRSGLFPLPGQFSMQFVLSKNLDGGYKLTCWSPTYDKNFVQSTGYSCSLQQVVGWISGYMRRSNSEVCMRAGAAGGEYSYHPLQPVMLSCTLGWHKDCPRD